MLRRSGWSSVWPTETHYHGQARIEFSVNRISMPHSLASDVDARAPGCGTMVPGAATQLEDALCRTCGGKCSCICVSAAKYRAAVCGLEAAPVHGFDSFTGRKHLPSILRLSDHYWDVESLLLAEMVSISYDTLNARPVYI